METEAYFISHCDNESCDLGAFQCKCPSCNLTTVDYDIWWKDFDIYLGEVVSFTCEKCGIDLEVYWDKKEYLNKVKIK